MKKKGYYEREDEFPGDVRPEMDISVASSFIDRFRSSDAVERSRFHLSRQSQPLRVHKLGRTTGAKTIWRSDLGLQP
jgi:hypothetical protein